MSILNKIPWINAEKLTTFILSAQVRTLPNGSRTIIAEALLHRTRTTAVSQTDRGTSLTSFILTLG